MFLITDITHTHLRQFPDEVLQPYVDEGVQMFIDLAGQLGVAESDISTTLSTPSKQLIRYYVVFRFAEDSIGVNNPEVQENDLYKRLKEEFIDNYRRTKPEITANVIRGVGAVGRENRAISTGRMVRSS